MNYSLILAQMKTIELGLLLLLALFSKRYDSCSRVSKCAKT